MEGRAARDQLIEQYAQGPPVHGIVVARTADSLWREVLGSAAHGEGAILDDLGETKVDHLGGDEEGWRARGERSAQDEDHGQRWAGMGAMASLRVWVGLGPGLP